MKIQHLRVNGQQKLSLMRSYSPGIDSLHQTGVFVDEPGFSKHIGSSVFQLEIKCILFVN